jgi:hypothetical protein
MENLIDKTYFWGELKIPGLSDPENEAELNLFISQYQQEFLTRLLGEPLALLFPGILKSYIIDDTRKLSPLANYVFFYYQKNNATFSTAAGEKNLLTPNTSIADDRPKTINAWNKMVGMNQIVHQKLYEVNIITDPSDLTVKVNYLNDILYQVGITNYQQIVLQNRKISIQLFGGIFSMKNIYDINP